MPPHSEFAVRLALSAVLTALSMAAQAAPGEWFAPSPCQGIPQNLVTVDERALLSVHDHPNTLPHDAVLRRSADGVWWAEVSEWQHWTRLPPPQLERGTDGVQWVPLTSGPQLHMRLDACSAELWVQVGTTPATEYALNPDAGEPAVTPAVPGGFLNIEARYGGFNGDGVTRALLDLGAFNGLSSARSGFLAGDGPLRRLDSTLIFDQPDEAQRLRLGDALSRGVDGQAPVRFGGVQWGTDYSLTPSRILFPLPSLSGSATLPSTADLFVNGQRVAQQQIGAGPYRLSSVPVLTGAGDLQMIVRDPLGHEQSVNLPFYASQRLLAPGLSDYRYEAGFLREQYAGPDDRYTHPFAAYSLRQGIDETLTGNLHAEIRNAGTMFGAGFDLRVGTLGMIGVSAAASDTQAGAGGIGTLAFERVGPHLSLSLSRRQATSHYTDIAQAPGTLRTQDSARLSFNAAAIGSFSAIYVSQRSWEGAATPMAGLSYSAQLQGNCYVFASYLHPLHGHDGDNLMLGINVMLGRRTSAGVQTTHAAATDSGQLYAQRSRDGALGWSWRARYDESDYGVREGEAEYAGEHGSVSGGFAGFDGDSRPTVGVSTGFAWLDGRSWWTRPASQSFAVVDAGYPDVRVYRDNLLVGRSGTDGRLLVPELRPYEANHLSIEPDDLPLDRALARKDEWVAPPANAGVRLRFSLETKAAVQLNLRDAAGAAPPAGAELFLDGSRLALPLGHDGLVYAEIDEGAHRLEARWALGHCEAEVQVRQGEALTQTCRSLP